MHPFLTCPAAPLSLPLPRSACQCSSTLSPFSHTPMFSHVLRPSLRPLSGNHGVSHRPSLPHRPLSPAAVSAVAVSKALKRIRAAAEADAERQVRKSWRKGPSHGGTKPDPPAPSKQKRRAKASSASGSGLSEPDAAWVSSQVPSLLPDVAAAGSDNAVCDAIGDLLVPAARAAFVAAAASVKEREARERETARVLLSARIEEVFLQAGVVRRNAGGLL